MKRNKLRTFIWGFKRDHKEGRKDGGMSWANYQNKIGCGWGQRVELLEGTGANLKCKKKRAEV